MSTQKKQKAPSSKCEGNHMTRRALVVSGRSRACETNKQLQQETPTTTECHHTRTVSSLGGVDDTPHCGCSPNPHTRISVPLTGAAARASPMASSMSTSRYGVAAAAAAAVAVATAAATATAALRALFPLRDKRPVGRLAAAAATAEDDKTAAGDTDASANAEAGDESG
jgi:hypothetical protein